MSIRNLIALAVVLLVALVLICTQRARLPIYRLAPPVVTASSVRDIGQALAHAGGTVSETADRFFFRSGPLRVEVYKASGGVWAEDTTALWNPDLTPQLPDTSALRPATGMFVRAGHVALGPKTSDSTYASFEFTGFGASYVTTLDRATHTKTTVQLDQQLNFGARVRVGSLGGSRLFPITGGGGEFKATYGDQGRLIGYNGVWREITGVARRERLIPRARADSIFLQRMHGIRVHSFDARLAYSSAPAPFRQEYLIPVYIYTAKTLVAGELVPLQAITLPATSDPPVEDPPAERFADVPRVGSIGTEPPSGVEVGTEREVGVSWLGATGGLSDAKANIDGLLEALRGDGWTVNFNWGDKDAWHQDWANKREEWVDAADMVFYTGHARMNGWMLQDHQNASAAVPFVGKSLSPSDVASFTDSAYGAQDLEWLVISACGPLQDEELSPGGGSALDRWSPAFGGLHMLLGFGSMKYSRAEEGMQFAQHLLEGKTLVNAWFRTASELQDPTNNAPPPDGPNVWVGAMWAYKTGRSPWNDHLWGHGGVAADSKEPTTFRILWSQI